MTLLIGGIVCCGECDQVFGTVEEWNKHMAESHPSELCVNGCPEPRVTASGLCVYCEDQLC